MFSKDTYASRKKPLILLLLGFPELAFSRHKIMLSVAADKYHVVTYDQCGYGRTSGWDTRPFSEVDLRAFTLSTLVTDAVRLVYVLGYMRVECVIGHDFGSLLASLCALIRDDIFKRQAQDCFEDVCSFLQPSNDVLPIHWVSKAPLRHCA